MVRFLFLLLTLSVLSCNTKEIQKAESKNKKIVIAHRGASGYLPEHTLPAKAMAYAMNVDFIEQDIVLSKDDVPIVIHDIHLETVSDVAIQFPDKKREDNR